LLSAKVPFAYIEVNAPIARGGSKTPNSWCAIRQTLQLPCLVLSGLGWGKWSVQDCARPVGIRSSNDEGTAASSSSGDSPSSGDTSNPWHPKPYELLRSACEHDFQDLHVELGFLTSPTGETHSVNDTKLKPSAESKEAAAGLSSGTGSESSSEGSERTHSGESPGEGFSGYFSGGDGVPGGPVRNRTQPGAAPDWAKQALEVRLVRGVPGTREEQHVVRIFLQPTLGSLRELADASDAAAMAWRYPLPSSHSSVPSQAMQNQSAPTAESDRGKLDREPWWASPNPAPDAVDWAVHRALKRILRSAEYVIEVPSEPA